MRGPYDPVVALSTKQQAAVTVGAAIAVGFAAGFAYSLVRPHRR